VLQRQSSRPERPLLGAGGDEEGAGVGARLRGEDPLVRELGQRLGAQVTVGAAERVSGEVGMGVRRGPGGRRGRRRRQQPRYAPDLRGTKILKATEGEQCRLLGQVEVCVRDKARTLVEAVHGGLRMARLA